jgi:molecular chaperone GrpE
MESAVDGIANGTIVKVFQPGYMISDRVLRPAMVVVAKGGKPPADGAAPPQSAAANDVGPDQDQS